MTKIVNLTQHNGSPDQIEQGLFDLADNTELKALLTVEDLPTPDDIYQRAIGVVAIAKETGAEFAMIGGAPFLMGALETELKKVGIQPLYAFSKRISVEAQNEHGETIKTNVFKHIGFVSV